MFDVRVSAIVTTEVQSRQYHQEIREALESMSRGERALITLAEAEGNDTDGFTLDVICVSNKLYNVQLCTFSESSIPDGILDLDEVINAYTIAAQSAEEFNNQDND